MLAFSFEPIIEGALVHQREEQAHLAAAAQVITQGVIIARDKLWLIRIQPEETDTLAVKGFPDLLPEKLTCRRMGGIIMGENGPAALWTGIHQVGDMRRVAAVGSGEQTLFLHFCICW